jgi:hypothetical protein
MGSDDGTSELTEMGRRHGGEAGRQASAGTAGLERSHRTKDFGGRTAEDASFSVVLWRGVRLTRPNGAGKSMNVGTRGTRHSRTSSAGGPNPHTGPSPASGSVRGRAIKPDRF